MARPSRPYVRLHARRHGGQAMIEVVVVTVIMVLALCMPWMGGLSPVDLLLTALGSLTSAYIDWLKVI